MAISYVWAGDSVTKKYDDGTEQSFDVSTLSDAMRTRLFQYGVQQKLSDCHSQFKEDSERQAMTEAQWEAFGRGEWNLRGAADRIVLATIDWEKLADAVAGTKPADQQDAYRTAVLAKRSLAESDDEKERKQATKLVKRLLQEPAIAEAYGWKPASGSVDDLLGIE